MLIFNYLQTLIQLDLAYNKIGNDGGREFSQVLRNNEVLLDYLF